MHLLFAVQRPLFSFGFSLPFQRGHHVQKYLLICFANTTHMREFSRINEPMFQLHVTTQSQFSPFSAKSHIVCFNFSFTSPQKWWYKSKLRPISIYCIQNFTIEFLWNDFDWYVFLLLKAIFQLRKTSFLKKKIRYFQNLIRWRDINLVIGRESLRTVQRFIGCLK